MKQKLLILLAAILAAVSAHAFSYTYEDQTLYYTKTSDTTCKVTSCKANTKNGAYIIPETVTYNNVEYTVTEIAENAFKDITAVTSLVIPETVTSIGQSAFQGCIGLESINIPEGVTTIDYYTFSGCSNLASVVIPETVTSIGSDAFSGCSSLTSVEIPQSVTYFGENPFNNCTSLEAFYGKYASDDHRCLIRLSHSVVSPVYEILAFAPGNITDYSIPEGVERIASSAFSGCTSLTSVVIPETVTSIFFRAFQGCSNLASVVIPETVTSIYADTFSGCSSLTSVVIPDGVSSIGSDAFYGCSSLTSVEIPESVTSIGSSAFSGCSNLTSVEIPESVTSIGSSTFSGCSNLTSVEIPESVTSIGSLAFEYCSKLESIVIPESVTSIGTYTFAQCYGLKSIKVENSDPSEISLGTTVFNGVDHQHCYLFVPKGSEDLYAEADQWKEFMKINYRVLNDGEAYQAEENAEEPNVDYIREFKNTNWQPLYLPFAMDYDEWSSYADVAELYNVRGYDRDNDGEIDDVTIEFNRLKEGASIQPNIPYVIKAKETGKVTFECKDKVVTAAPATEGMVECSSTKFTYAFHGIYEEKTDLFFTGAYFLSKGNFYQAANENVILSPYRAYLTVTPKTGGYNGDITPAKAPQRITLVVDDEMETNDIEDIIDTAPHDDVYYDLMGRKVVNPTSGLYIHNGRKVYIK